MQFSNTTDKNGIIQRCEDYTGIGDGNITGDTTVFKKFTANVNEAVYELVVHLMRSIDGFDWDDVNYTTYPIGKAVLTTSRDYVLPTSLHFLTIKRIDVSWDGVTWYQAKPIDSGEMKFALGNEDEEDTHFTLTEPRYDVKSNGFWLYPRATAAQVAAGAQFRIEFTRDFDEFTIGDSSQEPPLDRPFHDLVPIGASLKWAVMKDQVRAQSLKTLLDEGKANMSVYYGRKNTDEQLLFNPQIGNYH